jgi:hypothetical protein
MFNNLSEKFTRNISENIKNFIQELEAEIKNIQKTNEDEFLISANVKIIIILGMFGKNKNYKFIYTIHK